MACEQRRSVPISADTNTYAPPKTVVIQNPRVASLVTGRKLQAVPLTTVPTEYVREDWNGTMKEKIEPPETKPAGFYAHMQNFTTDQGHALDALYGSYIDHMGNLWFGTNSGGVSRYGGKQFTTFTSAQGLASNVVMGITEDQYGNMWFATRGGVSKYDGKRFTTYTTAQGLVNNDIWFTLQDKKGNLWFASYGFGVSKFDGKVFTNYTTAQGLASNLVSSMAVDKEGNVWFSSYAG